VHEETKSAKVESAIVRTHGVLMELHVEGLDRRMQNRPVDIIAIGVIVGGSLAQEPVRVEGSCSFVPFNCGGSGTTVKVPG
jgi:hypothetical protein